MSTETLTPESPPVQAVETQPISEGEKIKDLKDVGPIIDSLVADQQNLRIALDMFADKFPDGVVLKQDQISKIQTFLDQQPTGVTEDSMGLIQAGLEKRLRGYYPDLVQTLTQEDLGAQKFDQATMGEITQEVKAEPTAKRPENFMDTADKLPGSFMDTDDQLPDSFMDATSKVDTFIDQAEREEAAAEAEFDQVEAGSFGTAPAASLETKPSPTVELIDDKENPPEIIAQEPMINSVKDIPEIVEEVKSNRLFETPSPSGKQSFSAEEVQAAIAAERAKQAEPKPLFDTPSPSGKQTFSAEDVKASVSAAKAETPPQTRAQQKEAKLDPASVAAAIEELKIEEYKPLTEEQEFQPSSDEEKLTQLTDDFQQKFSGDATDEQIGYYIDNLNISDVDDPIKFAMATKINDKNRNRPTKIAVTFQMTNKEFLAAFLKSEQL
jgi:hypothetical protein